MLVDNLEACSRSFTWVDDSIQVHRICAGIYRVITHLVCHYQGAFLLLN